MTYGPNLLQTQRFETCTWSLPEYIHSKDRQFASGRWDYYSTLKDISFVPPYDPPAFAYIYSQRCLFSLHVHLP